MSTTFHCNVVTNAMIKRWWEVSLFSWKNVPLERFQNVSGKFLENNAKKR